MELSTEYLEDTLPSEDKARFEQHLVFCDWCRTYLDQMRLTIRTLGSRRAREELLQAFSNWKGYQEKPPS